MGKSEEVFQLQVFAFEPIQEVFGIVMSDYG